MALTLRLADYDFRHKKKILRALSRRLSEEKKCLFKLLILNFVMDLE